MKKKIKDLTLLEANKICCSSNDCSKCPLNFDWQWCGCEFNGIDIKKSFPNEIEKEVEVIE